MGKLERVPGKQNWVDRAGGLPSYIERIAVHLHEKGKEIGTSIAIAVNVAKKMCATGDLNFPGVQQVNAGSKAEACKAVAEWERKKAGRVGKAWRETSDEEFITKELGFDCTGWELIEGVEKFNPFHAPAGSPAGGQFAAEQKGEKSTQRGKKGQRSKNVQHALNALGAAKLEEDSKFGPKTQAAVMAFQRKHGLKPDGIVGPKTLKALRDEMTRKGIANAGQAYQRKHKLGRFAEEKNKDAKDSNAKRSAPKARRRVRKDDDPDWDDFLYEVEKINPHHGPDGKFTSGPGTGSHHMHGDQLRIQESTAASNFDYVMNSSDYDEVQKRRTAAAYGDNVIGRLSSGQPVSTSELTRLARVHQLLTHMPKRPIAGGAVDDVTQYRDDYGRGIGHRTVRKDDDVAENEGFEFEVPIAKIDDEKRLAFGWASVTVEDDGSVLVDKQGDRIEDTWELEKAAYDYVVNSRDGGVNHAKRGVAELVESIVFTPEKLEKMGLPTDAVDPGWWVGYRVSDDDVWKGVKDGTYRMFSVHGVGKREEVPNAE